MSELVFSFSDSAALFYALASKTRRKILHLLYLFPRLNISALAKQLKQSEANVSAQVKILEKAQLVQANYKPARHGVSKRLTLNFQRIIIKMKENGGE